MSSVDETHDERSSAGAAELGAAERLAGALLARRAISWGSRWRSEKNATPITPTFCGVPMRAE